MTIKTRPATPEYRDNWERIFGRKQELPNETIEAPGRPIHGMPVHSPALGLLCKDSNA